MKELVDNAIDAAEEAGVPPMVEIAVSSTGITVTDNGAGLAPETIVDILDYSSRTSSREAYVSPTRGAQGNALKTLLAMPFVLDGQRGESVIESRGVAHTIGFDVDHIRREPRIEHSRGKSSVKKGARITVHWPSSASSILDRARLRFFQVAAAFSWLNPHLTIDVRWNRGESEAAAWAAVATDQTWRKWKPSDPTSAHWYDCDQLGAPHCRANNSCCGSQAPMSYCS